MSLHDRNGVLAFCPKWPLWNVSCVLKVFSEKVEKLQKSGNAQKEEETLKKRKGEVIRDKNAVFYTG